MDKVKKLEQLEVYLRSIDLVASLYKIILSTPSLVKEYFLADQLKRSCVSIPSNISEGYERGSKKDFIRFLYIAKGSCSELRTQLLIAKNLRYITEKNYLLLNTESTIIIKMLSSLINYLKTA